MIIVAISKLNLDWKNKGETGYEDSKMNKAKMGDITDKIDEIIDSENAFDTHNFGTSSGYQKFPSGLMIQWGNFEIELTSTQVDRTLTFPKVFSNSCFTVLATMSDPGSGSTVFTGDVGVPSFTNSNAIVRVKSLSSYVTNRTINVRWLAIGY